MPAIILAAISGVSALIDLINKLRADAQQSAEWTDAQRAAFDAKLANLPTWWTPDA